MSGLEPLAIVGAAAGLIQALDSGIRIVKQIKERRRAHGALLPPTILEESFETGKREIENVLQEGSRRFGPTFVEGDMIAKLAILEITVQTQNALLERLTAARDDDGIVDFDEVIDLSDQGRNEALIELRQLFSRRLKEDMARKNSLVTHVTEVVPVNEMASLRIETRPPEPRRTATIPPAQVAPQRPPQHSRQPSRQTTLVATPQPLEASQPSRIPSRFWGRKSSTASKRSTTTPITPPDADISPTSLRLDHRHSIMSISSDDTSRTCVSPTGEGASGAIGIQKYAGTCKYAHEIREKKPGAGLRLQDVGMLYSSRFTYKCKSAHCEFSGNAIMIKGKWEINNKIQKSAGLQYRWIFLAKSHVAFPKSQVTSTEKSTQSQLPYLCLICAMSKREAQIYTGHQQLFEHIATHQAQVVGDMSLQGPLKFTNAGLKMDKADFDIEFPVEMFKARADTMQTVGSQRLYPAITERDPPVERDANPFEAEPNPWLSATTWFAAR